MSGAPFIATVTARQAVAGRETEILDKLGIPWRSGRPHIDCPYPEHGGRNDWRWDEREGRAYCTCVASHSIFDVLMKIEGIDFEAAKLRALELVGRTDILQAADGASRRFQKTNAGSLMNVPAVNRDDRLPSVYLAHRLGVPVEQVPVPGTAIVGLKALGYFDPPPSGSKEQPIFVGEYPCAVFGTVAADGKTHAHRIYLAPDGRSKAELGETSEGEPRNPKKSARVKKGDNTAGRSVL